jgi:hypothetical protein
MLSLEFHSKYRARADIIALGCAAGVQEIVNDNKKQKVE